MSPYETIYRQYQEKLPDLDFPKLVGSYMTFGFVFSTPVYFMMGKSVNRRASPDLIRDPSHRFAREECDAWWIHAATGNMAGAWKAMPWPLPWVGFQRFDDDLHFYPLERMNALAQVYSHDA